MIVVFTSDAFTEFIKKYVQDTGNSTFNPYLQVLFFALYVFPVRPLFLGYSC